MDTNTKNRKLLILFLSTLKISAFTFGGGFVIVPLMRDKFVKKLHWIEEEEMVDLTAIAQSCPGPIAVNAAIGVGYRVAGVLGAFVAVLGSIIPPLFIITLISHFYDVFRSNIYVSKAMKGMLAAIAAIILDVVLRMGKDIVKTKRLLYLCIMIVSFVLVRVVKINIEFIILVCIIIGILDSVIKKKEEQK